MDHLSAVFNGSAGTNPLIPDASVWVALSLGSFALFLILYVWTALALSAVFRKSGLPGWQAWVPVLNVVILLQLGALSGWLLLFALLPGLGLLLVWIFVVMACYRINVSFGFGAGMTVLAALSLPIWASVLGFGSARWIGAPASSAGTVAGPRRAAAGPSGSAPAGAGTTDPLARRVGESPPSAPASVASFAPVHHVTPQAAASGLPSPTAPIVTAAPVWSSVPEPASAPAFVPSPPVSAVEAETGFDLGAVGELTSDVTDAVEGAPAPVSAMPPVSSVPLASFSTAEREQRSDRPSPPVTRVPAAPRPASTAPLSSPSGAEPWAPRRSARENADAPSAFTESSAEISAIAGAPDAGTPRSARASVSAQHTRPEIPDEPIDETIITRRKRTAWSLIPPGGTAVALSSAIVIVGRKPSADAAFPGAQLVSVDDGTVSKTHARLELREERWYITDLGSTNGVLFATLMGTEIEATPGVEVEAGERFYLGDAEVRLQRSDG
jgi:Family of unknown function (DUF5684)/FHA domain